jgi:hypothetical protein
MLVSYAIGAVVLFTPAGLIGAVVVIALARVGLRIWWRLRH